MALNKDLIKERLKEAFGSDKQKDIGEKLNIAQSTVSKLCSGEMDPTAEMLNNIASVYDVSADWLLGISDKKKIDKGNLTYADILRWFDKMASMGAIWPYPNQMFSVDGKNPELPQVTGIGICDEILQSILYEWKHQMTGSASDIYDMWLEKRLREYSEIPYIEWNEIVKELFYHSSRSGDVNPDFLKKFAKVCQEENSKSEE